MRRSCILQTGSLKSDAVCGAQYIYAAVTTDTWWVVKSSPATHALGGYRQTVCKCVLCLYTLGASSWLEIYVALRVVLYSEKRNTDTVSPNNIRKPLCAEAFCAEETLMNMYSYAHRVRSKHTSIVDVERKLPMRIRFPRCTGLT